MFFNYVKSKSIERLTLSLKKYFVSFKLRQVRHFKTFLLNYRCQDVSKCITKSCMMDIDIDHLNDLVKVDVLYFTERVMIVSFNKCCNYSLVYLILMSRKEL